jgi:hypothetical protein
MAEVLAAAQVRLRPAGGASCQQLPASLAAGSGRPYKQSRRKAPAGLSAAARPPSQATGVDKLGTPVPAPDGLK